MQHFKQAKDFIHGVRRARRRVAALEWSLMSFALLGLGGALSLGTAWGLGPGPGFYAWAWLVLAVLGLGWLSWRLFVRPWRLSRSDIHLAQWIEAKHPAFDSALVTTVEQGASGGKGTGGASPALVRETALRAAREAAQVRPQSLVETGRLRRWAAGTGLLALVLAGLAWWQPGAWTEGARALTEGPTAEASERLVDVLTRQLDVEIQPPSYTQLEPRKILRSSGDFEAIEGSRVRLSTEALYPIKEVALVLESQPEKRWEMKITEGGILEGGLQVGADDRYQFVGLGPKGELIREKTWRRITARPDRPPTVTLLMPEDDTELRGDEAIEIIYEAEDDLGIDQLKLVIESMWGGIVTEKTLSSKSRQAFLKGQTTLMAADLKLGPGEAVYLYIEAQDFNDREGPGVGRSERRRLSLHSPEDEHARNLASLRELLERLLDVLAERLESPVDEGARVSATQVAQLHGAIQGLTAVVLERFSGVLLALDADPLAEPTLKETARGLFDRLGEIGEQEAVQLRQWELNHDIMEPKVWLTLIGQTNEEGVAALEEGILALRHLINASLKDAVMEAGKAMLETQEEMMRLLEALKDTDDPEARAEAMRKLRQLKHQLDEMQKKLAALQERAPYENQNRQQRPSERQEEVASIDDQMDAIEKLLAEGKVEEAMALLEEMTRSTQEMVAGLQEDLDGIGRQVDPERQRQEAALREQLDHITDGQRGLQRETDALEQAVQERQQEAIRQEHGEALEALQAEAEKLKAHLEEAQQDALHADDRDAAAALAKEAEALEEAIAGLKMAKAKAGADEIADGAEQLRDEVEESEKREDEEGRLEGLRAAMEALKESAEAAKGLSEKLAEMTPQEDQEPLSPAEEAERQRLKQQQEEIIEQVSELESMCEEGGGAGEPMREPLGEAKKAMEEAAGELQQGRPEQAKDHQQQALEQLQEAKKRMQEGGQQQDKPGDGEDGREVDPRAKVELPEEGRDGAARRLREEIIRAMGEEAPDAYRDAIKTFYEELTR